MGKARSSSASARKITIENGTGFNATTHWMMAAVLLCAGVGLQFYLRPTIVLDINSPDFDPVAFVPIVAGVFGLGYLALAIRGTLIARKFGTTVLEINGDRVELGRALKGVIRCAADIAPTGDYVVNLQCIESVPATSSINRHKNNDRLHWEATRKIDPKSVDARQGIPVQFDLPLSAMANGDSRASGVVRWVMDVKAQLPGTDFYAVFVFAVQPKS